MICGHDRETLRLALSFAQNAAILAEVFVSLGDADRWRWCHNYAWLDALKGVHDPTKLAAVIAELLQEHGVHMMLVGIAAENVIHAHVKPTTIHRWLMPQARVFALALLDSPQVTTQDIERMIGEL